MAVSPVRYAFVGPVLLLVLSPAPARPQPKPADPADDPLPEGAKLRFGTTRPILRDAPHVGLIGPKFTEFLAPTLDGRTRRYNLGTGRPLNIGSVGAGQVVVSADGRRAAVARPAQLSVVDVATGQLLLAVKAPEGVKLVGTPGVSLSAKGERLAYGGTGKDGKGEIVVLDVDENAVLARIVTAQPAPLVPVLSPDGKTLVTHGPPAPAPTVARAEPGAPPAPKPAADPVAARTARVWDVARAAELFQARVSGLGGHVVSAAFSADGSFFAASAGDGPVELFDVKTGTRTQTLLGRKGQGVKVAVAPDGKTVAAVAADFRIQRWTADGKALGVTAPPPGVLVAQLSGLQFADDERVVAWLTAAQFAVAWEAPTGNLLTPLSDHVAGVMSIAIPADLKDLYTSGIDGRQYRWDYATGLPTETITLRPAVLPGAPLLRPVVTLSADATRAISGQVPLEVFDVASGADLFVVPPPPVAAANHSYFRTPDGLKVVAVCSPPSAKRTGTCEVWDLLTERRVLELEVPPSTTVPQASLSADGSRLVVLTHTRDADTGKAAVQVTGWDTKTRKKLGSVTEPIEPDTVYVTAAGEDSAVLVGRLGRLWSVDYVAGTAGKDIDKLPTRREIAVYGPVVFSPDGKQFATGIQGEPFETFGVRVYDWPGGKRARTYIGHAAAVSTMMFTPDGKFLASGSQDTSVLLWDLSKVPGGK
ncbi:WD40 repeat domain-containing protein [Frigoriglobus tundricola]|uniref:Anaphase-promoting complex subunit 4 WD40 domain-containing protein n=1 Tax=Frigoriglobus tundricola TaxID=2774151 RepID=A0A6M5Z3M6_9BACT|nr:hypothetical protein [Frigoriglobus tundricola]QJX00022.1 hypothetical protein FTUN_7644 [Frigoriglobus tundricola]